MVSTKLTYHKKTFCQWLLFFFWKFCLFKNVLYRVDLIYQLPKCPYSYFYKRWSFIWRCFFPVSILETIALPRLCLKHLLLKNWENRIKVPATEYSFHNWSGLNDNLSKKHFFLDPFQGFCGRFKKPHFLEVLNLDVRRASHECVIFQALILNEFAMLITVHYI